MPAAPSSLQVYYAARAAEYDRIYDKPERQADLRRIEAWLPSRLAGRSVLEVACGTGYWTRLLAPACTQVVALDAAPQTVEIARSRVPADKVRFVIGDAYALPDELGPFEGAFAGFWFSHVPRGRRREFLCGLGRALRPGARVVLLDNLYVPGSSTPLSGTDDDGNAYQMRRLDDGSTHRVLKNFPDEAELRACVDGLGDACSFQRWPYYWAFEYTTAA